MTTRVLGIGAWDRSGSTVLAGVVGASEGVVAVGELNNLWLRGVQADRPCACGALFSRCEFWQEVMLEAFGGHDGRTILDQTLAAGSVLGTFGLVVDRATGRRRAAVDRYAAGLSVLYEGIARVSKASLIVDSAKQPWHLAIADQLPSVTLYTLHLVRDPRGVAYSLRKRMPYDIDVSRPRDLERQGSTFTALGWRYRNTVLARLWGGRDTYKLLSYETFAGRPDETVSDIFVWLDHPHTPEESGREREIDLPVSHSVSGNPVRFTTGPVTIRLDDEWRRELGLARRAWVDLLTWPMLTRYGYRL